MLRFTCGEKKKDLVKHQIEKIYQELGLECLESRRCFRKLCLYFKIFKIKSPDYLFRIIPQRRSSYIARNSHEISRFKDKHQFYKNSFFPSTTIQWKNVDQDLRNRESYTLLGIAKVIMSWALCYNSFKF